MLARFVVVFVLKGGIACIACEMEAVLDTDVGVAKITDFYPTLDKPARSESGTGAAVLVTGTTFTYQQAFVNAPVPTVTPIGSSAIIAVVSAYSTTGFTVKLYNTSGTEISGTINWISTGV